MYFNTRVYMRSYIIFFLFFQCLAWSYFFQDLSKAYIRKGLDILRIIQWTTTSEVMSNDIDKAPAGDVMILRENGTFIWFYASGKTTEGIWEYAGSSSLVRLIHSDLQQTYSVESIIDDNILLLRESNSHAYHEIAENTQQSSYLNQ
jgi:hypothetical protein